MVAYLSPICTSLTSKYSTNPAHCPFTDLPTLHCADESIGKSEMLDILRAELVVKYQIKMLCAHYGVRLLCLLYSNLLLHLQQKDDLFRGCVMVIPEQWRRDLREPLGSSNLHLC